MTSRSQSPLEVFIPFWGDPGLLYATVDSVKAQTDPDWTITVVDDCYPDPAVAEHFAAETDPRIRYLRNEQNLGITANYERCRDLASGDLMMFLGCDDLLLPDFVETVKAAHERVPQRGDHPARRPGHRRARRPDRHARRPGQARDPRSGTRRRPSSAASRWPPACSTGTGSTGRRSSSAPTGSRPPFRDDLPIIQDLALRDRPDVAARRWSLDPAVVFEYRRHTQSASATSLLTGRACATSGATTRSPPPDGRPRLEPGARGPPGCAGPRACTA